MSLRDGAIRVIDTAIWCGPSVERTGANVLDALLDYLEQEMSSRMPGLWYVSDMIAKLREDTNEEEV